MKRKFLNVLICVVMLLSMLSTLLHAHTALAENHESVSSLEGRWVVYPRTVGTGCTSECTAAGTCIGSVTFSGNSIITVEYCNNIRVLDYHNWWGGFYFGAQGSGITQPSTQPCLIEPAHEPAGTVQMTYRRTTFGTFRITDDSTIEVTTAGGETHTHWFILQNNSLRIRNVLFVRDDTLPPPEIFEGEFGITTDHGTIISTASGLASIGGSDGIYILANDIDIPRNWTPIENFQGTLDGAGHTVTLSVRTDSHLAAAGLFGGIIEGTVVIRNLSVRTTGTTGITANALNSRSSEAFAGGLIGTVVGGDITLENITFFGNVRATSNYCRFVTGLQSDPVRYITLFGLGSLAGNIAPWLYYPIYYGLYHGLYAELSGNGSRSHAGGFIGYIGGDAYVRISNSYAKGSVTARASASFVDASALMGTARARSSAGGLVGSRAGNSRLTIENSYVTNNIETWSINPPFRSPIANSGALVGGGGATIIGTTYRLNTQSLSVNRNGNTNTTGITGALNHSQMQNRSSFIGWDFERTWTIDPNRSSGFPHHMGFVHIAFQPVVPTLYFNDGFTHTTGSEMPLAFAIDMPLSSFTSVYVNGEILTQGRHYTVSRGSTIISLLPDFLDTLEDGFHALTINFDDGVIIQEYILVEETDIPDDVYITSFYVDDVLIFSLDEGLLVDESQLETLYYEHKSYSIDFSDGRTATYIDGNIAIGYANSNTGLQISNTQIAIIIVISTVCILAVYTLVEIKKAKQRGFRTTMRDSR